MSLQSGQTATAGVQVACVNPADLSGGQDRSRPWFRSRTAAPPPPAVTTPWVIYPDLYTSTCGSAGGATWLQVTASTAATTGRQVTEVLGPSWGSTSTT